MTLWRFLRYIKRSRKIRIIGIFSAFLLLLILSLSVFPITDKTDIAEATANPSTTTLSMTVDHTEALVSLVPVSVNGTFAASTSAQEARFTVTTNNVTGYSLSISASDDDGELVDSATNNVLNSISTATSEANFSANNSTSLNNKWGYKPNYFNSAANSNFLPSPTTTASTINETATANATGTSDSYNIVLGARVDAATTPATYQNTYTLIATANNVAYQINYLDNTGPGGTTGSDVTGLPAAEGSPTATISSFILSSTEPQRTGYDFSGWCYGTVDHTVSPSDCTGTVYQAGDAFYFNSPSSTTTNIANLYAMWENNTLYLQNVTPAKCTTTPTTAIDNRDNQEYIIKKMEDNRCWLITNLRLGATPLTVDLTSANTNLVNTIDATTFNSWIKDRLSNSFIAGDVISKASGTDATSGTPYGTYYNYFAASAGTISGSVNMENAQYDICPKGWRLPTGTQSGEIWYLYEQPAYGSLARMRASLANGGAAFALAGYMDVQNSVTTPVGIGSYGLYTTSTEHAYATNNGQDYMSHLYMINPSTINMDGGSATMRRSVAKSIRCILKTPKETTGLGTMQDIGHLSSAEKATLIDEMGMGARYVVTDSRNNKTYTVARMADGNVWMTQNLSFLESNLDSSTSNIDPVYTTQNPLTINWQDFTVAGASYNYTDALYHDSGDTTKGVWYSYASASAMSLTDSSNPDEIVYDICPAGWRLPTNAEAAVLSSNSTKYQFIFRTVQPGYYHEKTYDNNGSGYWWTSTKSSAGAANRLVLYRNVSYLISGGTIRRDYGCNVRCILKK